MPSFIHRIGVSMKETIAAPIFIAGTSIATRNLTTGNNASLISTTICWISFIIFFWALANCCAFNSFWYFSVTLSFMLSSVSKSAVSCLYNSGLSLRNTFISCCLAFISSISLTDIPNALAIAILW